MSENVFLKNQLLFESNKIAKNIIKENFKILEKPFYHYAFKLISIVLI